MLELLLVFDLKSVGYNEKEKGQTVISDDLSFFAPEPGLEPGDPLINSQICSLRPPNASHLQATN